MRIFFLFALLFFFFFSFFSTSLRSCNLNQLPLAHQTKSPWGQWTHAIVVVHCQVWSYFYSTLLIEQVLAPKGIWQQVRHSHTYFRNEIHVGRLFAIKIQRALSQKKRVLNFNADRHPASKENKSHQAQLMRNLQLFSLMQIGDRKVSTENGVDWASK